MKRAIVDLSSVIWTCLKVGKDVEHGRDVVEDDKKKWVNSAQWGYDNAINHLKVAMEEIGVRPHAFIVVVEGKNSKSGRQAIHPGYKAGRSHMEAEYVEFNKAKEMLLATLGNLGANICWQDGVEADDVIGYLAKHLKGETWIVSGDKDLTQCIGGNVHMYRRGEKDTNPFGPFDPKWIPVAIALMGDTVDKIPGAKGFGEKSFEKLLIAFGEDGLELMDELIRTKSLGRLVEDVGTLPELKKIIESASTVYMSYELGRLRIDKVNTMRDPLQWKAGMVKQRDHESEAVFGKYYGNIKLVSQENYAEALDFMKRQLAFTPFFSLDIETSTPPESDEWLEAQSKEDKVLDVFGSELTGLSITFGANLQFTYYLTHEHVETESVTNLTLAQVRDMVDAIPREKVTWVHNNSFELPVLYNEWGQDWKDDPEYHGFLRNVRDTAIASSYVDENRRRGLKSLSLEVLGYEQESYQHVTTIDYPVDEWDGVGKEMARWRVPVGTGKFETMRVGTGRFEVGEASTDHCGDTVYLQGPEIMEEREGQEIMDTESGPMMVRVQHKMNQLTAAHVLRYGADDTICTAALANLFTIIMEIEDTFEAFEEVETWPAYLTALAFVQGVDFNLEEMQAMTKEDDESYDKSWQFLREFLIRVGFEGTVCPVLDVEKSLDAPSIKLAYQNIVGTELKTLVRTPSKLAKLLSHEADALPEGDLMASRIRVLAHLVGGDEVEQINDLIKLHFKGEPKLDMGSSKQMQSFLYDYIQIPVQIVNDVTKTEREKKPDLADAIYKFKRKRMGKSVDITDKDLALLRKKAKTDDTAIDYALAFDSDSLDDDKKKALACVQVMKKVMTRRSLFYKNYLRIRHWKDGKIHASVNQCAAVTRRYSMSNPNLQQLPKKGEAVKFRGCFKPHHKKAVICSVDFTGQELRLAAERSQDKNMLACYIGDNLKDIHSITAAGAMRLKWGNELVNELTEKYKAELPMGLTREEFEYRLFLKLRGIGKAEAIGKKADDLRKDSKNVNFAAQFGGQAAKLSETLIMRFEDAQLFLDARSAMFPDVDKAARRAADFVQQHGYALTMMKARRHLRHSILSDDKRESSGAERQAWNMEIQGSAGEMTKIGMGRLWKSGALFKFDARFIAPVHDELVTSVSAEHAADFIKIKHECMVAGYADMKVPILGSISVGPDFANQTECGDWYIRENIEKAVNDIFYEKAAA